MILLPSTHHNVFALALNPKASLFKRFHGLQVIDARQIRQRSHAPYGISSPTPAWQVTRQLPDIQ